MQCVRSYLSFQRLYVIKLRLSLLYISRMPSYFINNSRQVFCLILYVESTVEQIPDHDEEVVDGEEDSERPGGSRC